MDWDDIHAAIEELMYGEPNTNDDVGFYMADSTFVKINKKARRVRRFLKRNRIKYTNTDICNLIIN